MGDLEVRDSDRARAPVGLELLEHLPAGDEVAARSRGQRPVDQEQVDVVGAELLQGLLECRPDLVRLALGVGELGGDPDGVAIQRGVAHRVADALLVAVHLGGVDVAVADLERERGRLSGVRRRDLEDAEAELGDRAAVVEGDRGDLSRLGHACPFLRVLVGSYPVPHPRRVRVR